MRFFVVFILSFLFHLSGQARCIKGNCHNGTGTFIFSSGAKYTGEFKNGKLHGSGILIFSNGDKYLGDWKAQHREGQGRLVFANGDEYIGHFKKNKFEGKGRMVYKDGHVYDGNWVNGKPNGKGVLTYVDHSRYEGNFLDGKKHGEGMMVFPNGEKVASRWKSDHPQSDLLQLAKPHTSDLSITKHPDQARETSIKYTDCNTQNCGNKSGSFTYRGRVALHRRI